MLITRLKILNFGNANEKTDNVLTFKFDNSSIRSIIKVIVLSKMYSNTKLKMMNTNEIIYKT